MKTLDKLDIRSCKATVQLARTNGLISVPRMCLEVDLRPAVASLKYFSRRCSEPARSARSYFREDGWGQRSPCGRCSKITAILSEEMDQMQFVLLDC
jgi:hypothetical protein